MLSRVAESIYWAGRYIERAENTARFIDVNLQMGLDAPSSFAEQWAPMVAIYGADSGFKDRYKEATRDNVIEFLAVDPLNPQLDPVLPPEGARECPLGARGDLV